MIYVIPVGQEKSMGLCNQLLCYFHTLYSIYSINSTNSMNHDESLKSSVFPFLILVDYFNMCIYNPKYIPFSSIVRESCWMSWIEEENKKLRIADISSVHDVECAMVFSEPNNNKIVFRSLTSECIKKRYHFTMDDLENISHRDIRTKRWKPLFLWLKLKYMFQGKTEIYYDMIKYDAQNQKWKHETLKYIPSCFRVDCEGNQEMEKRRNSFFQKLSFNFTSSIFQPLVHTLSGLTRGMKEEEKMKILIHLRVEKDAIAWWSKRNHLEEEEFKMVLENKYDSMISKIIMFMTKKGEKKNVELYFLGHQIHGHVLVQKYKNSFYFDGKPENLPREIAAIYDVEWARQNGRMYDCILFPLSGSTFSMMLKLLIPSKSFFHFDMNKIDREPIFENAE
jgi:hypothetical protein